VHLKLDKLGFLLLALTLTVGGLASSAIAGSAYHDRVYADSFGNLVIHSRAGYKRIIVGAGHRAAKLGSYEQSGDDDVVYLDEKAAEVTRYCYRPPVFFRGRSHMYGFDQGEIPTAAWRCR
jgi:hypothetical protein